MFFEFGSYHLLGWKVVITSLHIELHRQQGGNVITHRSHVLRYCDMRSRGKWRGLLQWCRAQGWRVTE